jgi:hypothetical protein
MIPDYLVPVIGYRAWGWVGSGLKSFHGELWVPGEPLAAACLCHQAPHQLCTCGIYAAKSLNQLQRMGYADLGVYGEVYLWGTIVEHSFGWRAQFAYPKTLVLPRRHFQCDQRELKRFVRPLTSYGADIFVCDNKDSICLWSRLSGHNPRLFQTSIAVLASTGERLVFLETRIAETQVAQVVFSQIGFPMRVNDTVMRRIEKQHIEVVIVDLSGEHSLWGIHAIELLRASRRTYVFAIGDDDSPSMRAAVRRAGASYYLEHQTGSAELRDAFIRYRENRRKLHRPDGLGQRFTTPPEGSAAPAVSIH